MDAANSGIGRTFPHSPGNSSEIPCNSFSGYLEAGLLFPRARQHGSAVGIIHNKIITRLFGPAIALG